MELTNSIDFNDLKSSNDGSILKEIIDNAIEPKVDFEEPESLTRGPAPAAKEFPIEALGDILGKAVNAIVDKIQCPVSIAGNAVLAVASLATQAHADIELPTGQIKPLSLFLATIAASGERKSAADNEALSPILRRENELMEAHNIELEKYKIDHLTYNESKKRILNEGKVRGQKKDIKTFKQDSEANLKALGPEPSPPLNPMIICPEPTFEGLFLLLSIGQPSVGIFSDEGGQFVGGHAMNQDNKLKTVAGLSSAWDGTSIKRVRRGDGINILKGKRVAFHLMIQPEAAKIFFNDRTIIDQGLLSRFLISAPDTNAGGRYWKDPKKESDQDLLSYHRTIYNILKKPFPIHSNSLNSLNPKTLKMSKPARDRWIVFNDQIEAERGPKGRYASIVGMANKLPEHASRIAAVLSLSEDINAEILSEEYLDRGIKLATYYAEEALRISELELLNPDIILAEKLFEWLKKSWPLEIIGLPEIYQGGPNKIRSKDVAERIVAVLTNHKWLIPLTDGCKVNGVFRKKAWKLHPFIKKFNN